MHCRVTVKSMSDDEEVESQVMAFCQAAAKAQAKGPNMFSLCTCWGTIFHYDVLILVTQIMLFVCLHKDGFERRQAVSNDHIDALAYINSRAP